MIEAGKATTYCMNTLYRHQDMPVSHACTILYRYVPASTPPNGCHSCGTSSLGLAVTSQSSDPMISRDLPPDRRVW